MVESNYFIYGRITRRHKGKLVTQNQEELINEAFAEEENFQRAYENMKNFNSFNNKINS